MKQAQPRPDWAPDECPDQVIQLLENEQFLENLGVRGLASSDSQVVRQAVRSLKFAIEQALKLGFRRGLAVGAGLGALFGAVAVYVTFAG